ncbi:MAG: hypothetical protein QHH00_00015 [Methanomassiliicoccales archaeon]|jgi:sporulation protein YlmC with PRC-barrel domain|nr:hypothetical protein [Methanomassiliicoccales archaeon]
MVLELSVAERKDVITRDGKKIGTLVGANVDTKTWTVLTLIVEVFKEVIEDLKIKKSVLKAPRITLKTDIVGVVGDVVQLNVDIKELREHI